MQIISEKTSNAAKIAASFLQAGKIISFATDTVYGIAVDASNSKAIANIYKIKNRDKNKPIAVFLPNLQAAQEIFIFNKITQKIIKKFSLNFLTLVLEKRHQALPNLAQNLNENDNFLGFRIVETQFLQELFKNFSGILAVTSANLSGAAAAISAKEVENYFNFSAIDLLIDGGVCHSKIPSTVVKISGEEVIILREGIIAENLKKLVIKS